MKRSVLPRAFVLSVTCLMLLVVTSSVAFAEGRPAVSSHATFAGVDLYGMSEAEASSTISSVASLTALPSLRFTVRGTTYSRSLAPSKYVTIDIERTLATLYAATPESSFVLTPSVVVSSAPISAVSSAAAKSVYRASSNARYYISKGALKVHGSVYSRKLSSTAAAKAIKAALVKLVVTRTAQPTLSLTPVTQAPSVTTAKLPRAILVDLSKRRLWLFSATKRIATYGVAIGMPGHTTPTGNFKIIARSDHPAWRNPGSDWATNMPAYIAPGPSNPLGVRALYLNTPGIRIHGTNKYWSIGHAASHGCMRVRNSEIVKLYPKVPVGTLVFIRP